MAPGKGFRSVAQYNAALFDLDGVLTPTIILHKAAWKQLFDEALARFGAAVYGAGLLHLCGRQAAL